MLHPDSQRPGSNGESQTYIFIALDFPMSVFPTTGKPTTVQRGQGTSVMPCPLSVLSCRGRCYRPDLKSSKQVVHLRKQPLKVQQYQAFLRLGCVLPWQTKSILVIPSGIYNYAPDPLTLSLAGRKRGCARAPGPPVGRLPAEGHIGIRPRPAYGAGCPFRGSGIPYSARLFRLRDAGTRRQLLFRKTVNTLDSVVNK